MKNVFCNTAIGVLIIMLVLMFGYGCWRVERWANWKFGYSVKVESRLVDIEKRIDSLEKVE